MRKQLSKLFSCSIATFLIWTAVFIGIPSIGVFSNDPGLIAPLNDKGAQAELYD